METIGTAGQEVMSDLATGDRVPLAIGPSRKYRVWPSERRLRAKPYRAVRSATSRARASDWSVMMSMIPVVLRSAGAALPDGGAQELVDSCPTLLGQRFAVDQHQCGYTVVFTVMAQPMTVLPAPAEGPRSRFRGESPRPGRCRSGFRHSLKGQGYLTPTVRCSVPSSRLAALQGKGS